MELETKNNKELIDMLSNLSINNETIKQEIYNLIATMEIIHKDYEIIATELLKRNVKY